MPVSRIVWPSVGFGTIPPGVDNKGVGPNGRGDVDFTLQALLRFVIDDITAVVCFDQRTAARRHWRKDIVTDMVMERLDYLVEITSHEKQVGFWALDRFAWCEHPQYGVCCAGSKVEHQVSIVFRFVLRPPDMHGPIPAPREGGNEPFPGRPITRKETWMAPAGLAAGPRHSDGFVPHGVEFPGSLVAPLLVLCRCNLKGGPVSNALLVAGGFPKDPRPGRD